MATIFTALGNSPTNALAVQHLIFPFQMWMGGGLSFLEDNASPSQALTAWVTLIIVYSIAAGTTLGRSLKEVVITKICLIAVFFAIAIILHPKTRAVSGLLTEAIISGVFEGWTFDYYLSTQFTQRPRQARQAKLLAFVIAGLLLIPHALSMLGLPTHLSLGIKPEPSVHAISILMNGLVNEGLILLRPSIFARLSIVKMPHGRNVLSKHPFTSLNIASPSTSRALYKITPIHQIALYFVMFLVWNSTNGISYAVKHPLTTIMLQNPRLLRARHSVWQTQLVLRKGLRLVVLREREELRRLLADVWAAADILTVLLKIVDVLFYVCAWGFFIIELYVVLCLCNFLYAKMEELYTA